MFTPSKDIDNKYRFVTLAALRAEQLQMGARSRLKSTHSKATIVAQEEVASGLVEIYDPEAAELEAVEALEAVEES